MKGQREHSKLLLPLRGLCGVRRRPENSKEGHTKRIFVRTKDEFAADITNLHRIKNIFI